MRVILYIDGSDDIPQAALALGNLLESGVNRLMARFSDGTFYAGQKNQKSYTVRKMEQPAFAKKLNEAADWLENEVLPEVVT